MSKHQQDLGEADWRRLSQLWALLDPDELKRAMRSVLGRLAKRLQAKAAAKLAALPVKNADKAAKSLWTQVSITKSKPAFFKASAGFKRKARKGIHLNERGLLKPAAMWLEKGTKERRTKGGRPTGSVSGYGFMLEAQQEEAPGTTAELQAELETEILRRSRKMGFI